MNENVRTFNQSMDDLIPRAEWPLPDIDRRQYPQLDYNTPWPQAPARQQEQVSAAAAITHAFLLEDASTTGPDVAKVRVHYGTINALDPTTGGDGPFNAADDPVFTIEVADGETVYVDLTVSYDTGTGIWSCTSFTIGASDPIASANPNTHAYYPIGTVAVVSNAVTAISDGVNGNIGWERCGTVANGYTDYWWAGP
jgi:hypothetical protein